MDINDQLDENAADLRNVEADVQSPQPNVPVVSDVGSPGRNASRIQIVITIGFLIAFVAMVYIFLQNQSIGSGQRAGSDPFMPKPLSSQQGR